MTNNIASFTFMLVASRLLLRPQISCPVLSPDVLVSPKRSRDLHLCTHIATLYADAERLQALVRLVILVGKMISRGCAHLSTLTDSHIQQGAQCMLLFRTRCQL